MIGTTNGFDRDILKEQINHWLRLLILYQYSQETAPKDYLPSFSATAFDKLKRKKQQASIKTKTLFKIQILDKPENNFGRQLLGHTWTLDHIVAVSGHFRWQPHGPERSLRKLIWIDDYVKGAKQE